MIRKQDIFPQKTECENPKHAKNSIENLFKGSQIKGLNKDYDRYYRRTNPPTFLVEKKHTRKQSIQRSMQRGPKKKTKQEREKDHKLLVKKKKKKKKVPLLCGFSHHPTPSPSAPQTRHTHENNYRRSLYTDSFLLLGILYTFTSRHNRTGGELGVFGSVAYDKSVLIFLE